MPQDRFLDLGETATRYALAGPTDAPAIVLIHEMGGSIESWDEVVPALQHRWRLIRYDMRGAGMAERLRADVSLTDLAGDVGRLLDRLSIHGPVFLAGGAVGAAVALAFAACHPERSAAVAAMSPALGVPGPVRADRHALADKAPAQGMRSLEGVLLEGGYPEALRRLAPDRWEAFRCRWLGNDPESFRFTYRMLIDLDFASLYDRIACPILAIGATLDPLRPPEQAAALAGRLANAEYVALDTGHHAAVQTPDLVAGALDRFFSRHVRTGEGAP